MNVEAVPYTRWWVDTGELEGSDPPAFRINGELYVSREDGARDGDSIVIGTQTGWLVPGVDHLAQVCDDTDVELAEAAEMLIDRNDLWRPRVEKAVGEEAQLVSGLLYADQMKIEAEYRGRGYGWAFLRKFISAFGGGKLVVTKPYPINGLELSEAEVKVAVRKLTKHWKVVGFRKVDRTPFMVRLPDEFHPLPLDS